MLISLFKAKCKHCGDVFVIATGSGDECNRCATIISLMGPLSVVEVERLLNARNTSNEPGRWRIRREDSEDRSE